MSLCSRWCGLLAVALLALGSARGQEIPTSANDGGHDAETPLGKPLGRMITLSDFGAEDLAYLCVPATPPTVGLVLVPDAFGLDDFTKAEAYRLASQGYLVVAIDIYNGHVTTDPSDLANLTANLSSEAAMKTLTAGIRLFHESPKFRVDHVVALGWGAGATYVFQAARENKTLDGAVMFYGPLPAQTVALGKFTAPLCAFYPENDPTITHEGVLAFQHAMKDAGNDCQAWFIAAGRGWSNPKSVTYNRAEDVEAWKVALPFLMRIAAEPAKSKDTTIIDKAKTGIEKAKDGIENLFK